MNRIIFLFFALSVFSSAGAAEKSLIGSARQQALSKPLGTVTWDHAPLRDSVTNLCRQQKIAILVDRRVNPDLTISRTFQNATLPEILRISLYVLEDPNRAVAQPGELYELSQTENVLYLGPKDFARKLLTLISLQNKKIPEKAKKIWEKKSPLSWDELARPREILEKIAAANQIKIANLKTVPHDLWPANQLPELTLTARITLILGQFGLTYDFDPEDASGKTILIKPLNLSEITLRKKYPKNQELNLAGVKEIFPDVKTSVAGESVEVEAPVEAHDFWQVNKTGRGLPSVGKLATGSGPGSQSAERPSGIPLNQRFTLEMRGPFFTILDGLRSKGLDIQYDADSLRAAGVDPLAPISISVKDATAAALFRDVAKQGGCEVEIRGNTVKFYKN